MKRQLQEYVYVCEVSINVASLHVCCTMNLCNVNYRSLVRQSVKSELRDEIHKNQKVCHSGWGGWGEVVGG